MSIISICHTFHFISPRTYKTGENFKKKFRRQAIADWHKSTTNK